MSEKEILAAILQKLSAKSIPVEVDLWDTEHIAAYLKRSYTTVRDKIIFARTSQSRSSSTPPRSARTRCTRRAR